MLCPREGDRLGRREGGRHVENSENSEGGGSNAEHGAWADGGQRPRELPVLPAFGEFSFVTRYGWLTA